MRSARRSLFEPRATAGQLEIGLRGLLMLASIMAVGLGLRLFRLDYMGYWHDEVISSFAARPPALEIFRSITANDTHPPLYHILLHFWGARFGYEIISLRLFSVLISLLCVPAVYLLGRTLLGHATGLVAAALMASSPFLIFHGQQARMYPLLTLLLLLTTLAFLAAWRRGGAWRWALFGLAAAAGFYTHVYFGFSLLGLNLWALAESVRLRQLDRRAWAGLILAQLVAVLCFSPFLLTMLTLTSAVVADFWIRGSSPLSWLFALMAILNNATLLDGQAPLLLVLLLYVPAVSALVLAVAFAVGQIWRGSDEGPVWALLLFALVTPCLVATVLSLTVRPILLDRSLIGVSGPLFILLAGAAVRGWQRWLTRALTAAVAVSIVAGLAITYPSAPAPHSLQPPLDALFSARRPGDAVILLDWQSFDLAALRYPDATDVYFGGPAASIGASQRRMAFMRWHTPDQVGPAEGYAGRYRRVWLFSTRYTYPTFWAATKPWLSEHGRLAEQREIGRGTGLGTLQLYEMRP